MINGNTSTHSANSPQKKRRLIAILVGLFLIATIALGVLMRKNEPNYYAPGRTHLVNAKIKLEQTLALEENYIQQRRQAHHEIETSIANLASVAEVDPQHRALIAKLLSQLKEIEKADLEGLPDAKKLHNQYQAVIQQMDELIQKLEKIRP
jgi:hypothetical protein